MDLIHAPRASRGKLPSHLKSLRPSLKVKSGVKRKKLAVDETRCLTSNSRIIRKVISKEQQYIKDLDFVEEVRSRLENVK